MSLGLDQAIRLSIERERMYQENAFCVVAKLSFIFCVETQNIIKDQTEYFRVHTCFCVKTEDKK